ncbi:type III secretion system export apparatus subunit SctU [Rhizobacter sp. Root1221]|uniref:type III secretion system export apparatus subunit SctU n=1 Tax=Rhizobacter sp. Root1221 TaxID=1736433 RepID=UPI0006F338C2|nr:type III secretion system export apparatus subunit SctU [Rhizobacter sp. Root1221]KQV99315.1 type III secretion system protein [Rhizobacter sp. Root1221]
MSEKTEEPTDQKLEKARKKGESPKSQDIVAAMVLIVSLLVLTGAGESMNDRVSNVVTLALRRGMQASTNQEVYAVVTEMVMNGMYAALPLVCATVLVAVLALFAQIGLNITFEPITPKFDKLNPASGLKKIFSVRSLIELAKSIVKAVALGCVIWSLVSGLIPLLVGSAYLTPHGTGMVAWHAMLKLLAGACVVFVVVGPVDFGLQRWQFMRDQRMSKDDIKREHKESEGDPHLKGHLKSMQQEMVMNAPEKRVPGATVVVTNPTHYAVALRYNEAESPVPVIVAKGMDEAAAVIRELAKTHRVPIIGNPPLARALHKLPLDQPIPEELFDAVAVVLRWVGELDQLGGKH